MSFWFYLFIVPALTAPKLYEYKTIATEKLSSVQENLNLEY
jgi:hypothetical protein